MSSKLTWLPIESNPEVMNKFLWNSGMPKSWGIHDVFGLDSELLAMLNQPVVGVLLLFPLGAEVNALMDGRKPMSEIPEGLYYMKQTISNACGTVAMIHAVANNQDKIELEKGCLKKFLDDTKNDTPEERAVKLEGNEEVCETHDQVAQEGQTEAPSLDESVDFHFVAFIEKNGHIYELDGRKDSPVDCGQVAKSFVESAAEECKKYMACDPGNIKFNVLALTPTQ